MVRGGYGVVTSVNEWLWVVMGGYDWLWVVTSGLGGITCS